MKCCNCECEADATHEAVLIVPQSDGAPSARGPMGIELCSAHAAEVSEWEFDAIQWALEPFMRSLGYLTPQPELAYAEAVPIRAATVN